MRFFCFYRRSVILISVMCLQFTCVLLAIKQFSREIPEASFFFMAISYGVVLWLLNSPEEPAYKICWLLLLLPFPVVGGCFFLLFRGYGMSTSLKKFIASMGESHQIHLSHYFIEKHLPPLPQHRDALPQIHYLEQQVCCSGFLHSKANYFSSGELFFPRMLCSLRKAERYIFLEYFIIAEGTFWNQVLEILITKVSEGILVRVIYDDAGCFFALPSNYRKKLEQYGIEVQVFHPLYPVLSSQLNHRDHRKIMVIDGCIALTGGINISDEYINQKKRFGEWKDSGLVIEGMAAWSMTVMFLTMWAYCKEEQENISDFLPRKCSFFQETSVILPYNNIPMDYEAVGQRVFLNLITRAKDFIHITSPYLILDTATQSALCNASKSGIEVRIITPHIPDKKLVFQVTRAFYPSLIKAGVQIYEFTAGFIHSKTVVVDGVFATIGTVNLDFRSLFLHFENGVWLWGTPCIQEMEQDFQNTLKRCQRYQETHTKHWGIFHSILRVFSPFM